MTDQLARRFIFRLLSQMRDERIEIVERGRRFAFGPDGAPLRAEVTVHSPHVYRQVLRGSTGLAETYMDGHWDTDDAGGADPDRRAQHARHGRPGGGAGTRCCTPASGWRG